MLREGLSRGRLPLTGCLLTHRVQPLVPRKTSEQNPARMPCPALNVLARCEVTQPKPPTDTADGDHLPIGRQRERKDRPMHEAEATLLLATSKVPDTDRTVQAPCDEVPAIGREGKGAGLVQVFLIFSLAAE